MQVYIQTRHFSLTNSLRKYAERRLRFALTSCHEHIQRVVMRLSDINGPRGGEDKRCQVHIILAGLPDIVIEDIEVDLYMAIDRATDRAGRTLLRKIDRQQSLLRNSRTPMLDTELLNQSINESGGITP